MANDRTILHCDCNGFFASVECIARPELKKVPMAVCGDPESRHGIILAKNELAKHYGIVTAETVWQAVNKCPDLVLVRAHHEDYQRYSRQINEIYQQYTDLVEPFSIDESWLDVTGSRALFGSGQEIADTLRARIRKELGLTISVGVSFNKIYAKLGSDYKKPDATTVISRDNYKEIVYPLPVSDLLFVGKKAADILSKHYIRTIGDLAAADRKRIETLLGKSGSMLWEYARGEDTSPVRPAGDEREIKSVGNSMTYKRDLTAMEDVRVGLLSLCDSVAARLRKHGLRGQTVQIIIKDPHFHCISRQRALPHCTDLAGELYAAALELVSGAWNSHSPIRMLSVTATNLTTQDTGEQMNLFEPEQTERHAHREKLEGTLDALRSRFGQSALSFGSLVNNDLLSGDEQPDEDNVRDHMK